LRRVLLYTIFSKMSIPFLKKIKIFSKIKIYIFLDKEKNLRYNIFVIEIYFGSWRSWGRLRALPDGRYSAQ
jgi:hypothetical protein